MLYRLLLVVAVLLGIGCGGDSSAPSTPAPTPSLAPTPPVGASANDLSVIALALTEEQQVEFCNRRFLSGSGFLVTWLHRENSDVLEYEGEFLYSGLTGIHAQLLGSRWVSLGDLKTPEPPRRIGTKCFANLSSLSTQLSSSERRRVMIQFRIRGWISDGAGPAWSTTEPERAFPE